MVADHQLRVAVLCGGDTLERGISLNSARSLTDCLLTSSSSAGIEAIYLNGSLVAHDLPLKHLWSNTPSDFDFRLRASAADGGLDQGLAPPPAPDPAALVIRLRADGALVFPALHGRFGEDGGLQALLEAEGVPFVGSGSAAASLAFDKSTSAAALAAAGFPTLPQLSLTHPVEAARAEMEIRRWVATEVSTGGVFADASGAPELVVKPSRGGSSVGVSAVRGEVAAAAAAAALSACGHGDVVVEGFARGREFSVIVLGGLPDGAGGPVALVPTEVELSGRDGGEKMELFGFRDKYLPSNRVALHTPPKSLAAATTRAIRRSAEGGFRALGLRDFARLDGFVIPATSPLGARILSGCAGSSGDCGGADCSDVIVFTDVNIISGMEQTSFLFVQAAEVGLSHAMLARHLLCLACSRAGLPCPAIPPPRSPNQPPPEGTAKRETSGGPWEAQQSRSASNGDAEGLRTVRVLFGGESSERQVSLMSGLNVWLKLRARLPGVEVEPWLLTPEVGNTEEEGSSAGGLDAARAALLSRRVIRLPYSAALRHTVEEAQAAALRVLPTEMAGAVNEATTEVARSLALCPWGAYPDLGMAADGTRTCSLGELVRESSGEDCAVFVALHGGAGEDGRLQALLEAAGVAFTGPGAASCRLCMDKASTGEALAGLASEGIHSAPKRVVSAGELRAAAVSPGAADALWQQLQAALGAAASSSSAGESSASAVLAAAGASDGSLCLKPIADGCSTGVARLSGAGDLRAYAQAVASAAPHLALPASGPRLEMPVPPPEQFLAETFLCTDPVRVLRAADGGEALSWLGETSRFLEVTAGVVEGPDGRLRCLAPSLTVKEAGDVLTLEEKFQSGTGVNLTPPPPSLVAPRALERARSRIARAAEALGIEGFARLDAFLQCDTGEVVVIEANAVPGMTPSTVLFHQALAEEPPVPPGEFLKRALDSGLARRRRRMQQRSRSSVDTK